MWANFLATKKHLVLLYIWYTFLVSLCTFLLFPVEQALLLAEQHSCLQLWMLKTQSYNTSFKPLQVLIWMSIWSNFSTSYVLVSFLHTHSCSFLHPIWFHCVIFEASLCGTSSLWLCFSPYFPCHFSFSLTLMPHQDFILSYGLCNNCNEESLFLVSLLMPLWTVHQERYLPQGKAVLHRRGCLVYSQWLKTT